MEVKGAGDYMVSKMVNEKLSGFEHNQINIIMIIIA